MNPARPRIGCLIAASLFATAAGAQTPQETVTDPAQLPETGTAAAEAEMSAAAPETPPLATIPVASTEEAPPEESPASGSRSRLVEEIVVTAQKREENLQDVPISIAAFSAESLDARGAFDTKALAQITPAVSITEFGGFSFIFIRGISSDAFVPSADPSVTTYVDGIFVPTSQGFSTDFGGVERVEVLKGPQGTLFGRNSTGGAINVITKKPGGEFEGSLQGTTGNYDERRLKAYLNVPVLDSLAFSFDGLFKEYDSQYEHRDRELIGHENKEGRVKGHWQPVDSFGITVGYSRSEQESVGSSISKNIDPSPLFSLLVGGPDADDYVAETDFDGVTLGYSKVLSGTVEWNLPWFDFKLIGADQTLYQEYTSYDFDGTAVPLVAFDTYGQFTDATNYEVQFLSRPDGWLGEDFEWVVGGYYLDGEGGFEEIYLRPASDILGIAIDNLQLPTELTDVLNPIIDPLSRLIEVNLIARGAVGTESLSGFFQGTWFATDWLRLTAGGRYTTEDRFLTYADTSVFLPGPNTPSGPGPRPTSDPATTTITPLRFQLPRDTQTNFSTKLSASFIAGEGLLFYLSRSTGFKSSTYNVINIYAPPTYVKPEEVTAYELGMKADFLDGALRVNSAVFRNEITNKQAAFVSLISGGAVTLLNAEKAHINGAEFDIILTPFVQSNPEFVVTANGAYLDAKYDKYTEGRGFGEVDGIYRQNQDYAGQEIERTPEFSGGLGLNQTLEAGSNGEFELGVDGYYNDGFFFSAENKDNYKQESYTLLNGRVGYWYRPWDVRLTVFGKNLTDERYQVALFETDFGILSTRAYEKQYGLTIDWKFWVFVKSCG